MEKYNIVRMYQNNRKSRIMRKNLTLEQTQAHCKDPETSSMTSQKACKNDPVLIDKWHEKQKHWFDGYTSV